uniref:Uncharacterized protein n=1 Tax=Peronospora matthiolae TaxID=2874970 RepID=A0AAV1UBV5_9STRA
MRSLFVFALWISGVLPATADPDSSTSESKGTALDAPAVESKSFVDGNQEDRDIWRSVLLDVAERIKPDMFKHRGRPAITNTYHQLEKPRKIKVGRPVFQIRKENPHKADLEALEFDEILSVAKLFTFGGKKVPRHIKQALDQAAVSYVAGLSFPVMIERNTRPDFQSSQNRAVLREMVKKYGRENVAFMIYRAKQSQTTKKVAEALEAMQFFEWDTDRVTIKGAETMLERFEFFELGSKAGAKTILEGYKKSPRSGKDNA